MTIPERIEALVDDFRGLPLTYEDLREELGLSKAQVHWGVASLLKKGRVYQEGGTGLICMVRSSKEFD